MLLCAPCKMFVAHQADIHTLICYAAALIKPVCEGVLNMRLQRHNMPSLCFIKGPTHTLVEKVVKRAL